MTTLFLGFLPIVVAAVAGGAFGLQYRLMRRYTVENSSFLSVFIATVPIPLIACTWLLPGWTEAIARAGFAANAQVFLFGFCWGLGAITYAFGFNILGMALAASLLKGISIAIGSGLPLLRHWDQVPDSARITTVVGLATLILGTALAGRAGMLREREARLRAEAGFIETSATKAVLNPVGRVFWIGVLLCLVSGFASAGANLGYDYADHIERAMTEVAPGTPLEWRATLVRWMPMYWGGISALTLLMGGAMVRNGTWRNFVAPGSARDCAISVSMGLVHFLAQIPYGIGAFYLGTLGTTVGWGVNIGLALIVATSLGFFTGEWNGASQAAKRTLYSGILVLIVAFGILAYAQSLAPENVPAAGEESVATGIPTPRDPR
ncbi:MAG TPA: L-rhamnose/proton symporter RhaT [Isosphaeraceae bacterium]|nr:L-rhamnose/proton symporter RhaT [Isosphaeraceae bacterium]